MSGRIILPPVKFRSFKPKRIDNSIGFYPEGGRATHTNRWQQTRSRLASHALWTGNERYVVYGGLAGRRWERIVTITQAEAVDFFEKAIADGFFTLKGMYAQALRQRAKRLPGR